MIEAFNDVKTPQRSVIISREATAERQNTFPTLASASLGSKDPRPVAGRDDHSTVTLYLRNASCTQSGGSLNYPIFSKRSSTTAFFLVKKSLEFFQTSRYPRHSTTQV